MKEPMKPWQREWWCDMEKSYEELVEFVKRIALEAGDVILKVYDSDDFNVELKGDNSPLTLADKEANNIITEHLKETDYPILSEEGNSIDYEERKNWQKFWLVDPLDGTKEFVKRNGEFTVNIALIENQLPVLGVLYAPVLKKLYYATKGRGAYLQIDGNQPKKLTKEKIDLKSPNLKVVASRSHLNEDTKMFLSQLINPEIVSMGSSLKFMILAEGQADVYPRFGPTMEWDTGAAHAIVREAGGTVKIKDTNDELTYNKKNLLNPYFLVS